MMSDRTEILCIGEILWDGLPSGLHLGGAPLNVCFHLHQFGINATMAGRVGEDRLGNEAVRLISRKGIIIDYIQKESTHETGFVSVELDRDGNPAYDIVEPAAWDFIEMTDALREHAKSCWGLVFGTLAQRNDSSRQTIQKLWEPEIKKILDLNLRSPYVDKQIIYDSLAVADIVKMNEDELNRLKEWYGLPPGTPKAAEQLIEDFDCTHICITMGENGAGMFYDGNWYEHNGFTVVTKDIVGAGDAFLAALLQGINSEMEADVILTFANAAGALVASRYGATPEFTYDDIEEIMAGPHLA